MKLLFRLASQWLLGLAIYVGGWYIEGPSFQIVQLGAVLLILAAGVFALFSGEVRSIRLSAPENILGGAFVFAMVVALVYGNVVSTMFGALFFLVLSSVAVLTRSLCEEKISEIFRYSYISLTLTIMVVEPSDFLASLSGTVERSIGLVRFEPLGMHPNLSGLVYGGGALLFLQHFFVASSRWKKMISLFFSFFCICVVLAASARASLFALGIASAVGVVLLAWKGSGHTRMVLVISATVAFCIVLLKINEIIDYLTIILDLESSTRGVESGATGRTDIWQDGVELVFSDLLLMFTGRGVRAAGPEVIGFPVESSYINLALEHGVVIGGFVVASFFTTIWRSLYRATQGRFINSILFIDGLMLLFVLAQSIFNRYLIAVGNPYSLLVLFLLLRLNLNIRPLFLVGSPGFPRSRSAAYLQNF